MKQSTIFLAIVLFVAGSAQAQYTPAAQAASLAYAKGDDSYLLFSDTYKADKKYTILKFWHEGEALTEKEKTEMESIKKRLAKKNIEVVEFSWKTEEDLKNALSKYNFKVELKNEKRIAIIGDKFNMNTTSGKGVLVLEENKPVSICSGSSCEDRLKTYFKIKAFN
jgi:hypothetical protein